jgi:hypothetical protein
VINIYTHITSFVTHTHSEVVANEVMAEDNQLVHVHPGPILLERSRIAANYQPLLGPFYTFQCYLCEFVCLYFD